MSRASPGTSKPSWLYRQMMGFLGLFDRVLFMSCRSFIRLTSAKYERPLRATERLRRAMHRAMCRICRTQERRMDQLHALAQELGHRAADEAEAKLSPQSIERLRKAMTDAAARSGDPKT